MTGHNVRGESNPPPFGRKRSSTVSSTSIFKAPTPASPLRVGDTTTLSIWVSDAPVLPVILNHDCWPGVLEGDVIEVIIPSQSDRPGFLFTVQTETGVAKQSQQQANLKKITISRQIADSFGFVNHKEVVLMKITKSQYTADFVEITFQDQYLGRYDMWRVSTMLNDQPLSDFDIHQVKSAYFQASSKTIFRSLSAKTTIFIQVCCEIWDFAGDGERYYEKIVHSFLPALFLRWRESGAKHIVTIVLISRVHYDQTELEYASGPLQQDDDGRWYKDFYKVITDLEVIQDWKPTLVSLKDSFFAFQRDILLTHHYHRAFQMAEASPSSPQPTDALSNEVRLVGSLSYAHDGPILEAINLSLNPNETHYIDRSLSLTGVSTILITPGTGYFAVSKRLLRFTTLRLLDQGFGIDLVCLSKKPLHRTPIFSFKGELPELRAHVGEKDGRMGSNGSRDMDPLWGGGDEESLHRNQFWWEPFWISTTFWDHQMDLPFRTDRFVARAKMQEIQMLGLLEHDLLSTIEIPFLDEINPTQRSALNTQNSRKMEADLFDMEVFSLGKNNLYPTDTRSSVGASSGSAGTIVPSTVTQSVFNREHPPQSLSSSASSRIAAIVEDKSHNLLSVQPQQNDALPQTNKDIHEEVQLQTLSASPSHNSVHSQTSSESKTVRDNHSSLASMFTAGWLFNPFKSSNPTHVLAMSGSKPSETKSTTQPALSNKSSITPLTHTFIPPKPVTIKPRHNITRNVDDANLLAPNRSSFRVSPNSSSPRDQEGYDGLPAPRRPTISNFNMALVPSSPPRPPVNPSRPITSDSYDQAFLARRWQHIYATPSFDHQIKWKSLVTPGCLPLTVEYFPNQKELDTAFEYFRYDIVVDPPSMSGSFCIKVSGDWKSLFPQEAKDRFALAVMKSQTAIRLAQGFQFVLSSRQRTNMRSDEGRHLSRRSRSFAIEEENASKPAGPSEILRSPFAPVYLSMTNEIHRLSYDGEIVKIEFMDMVVAGYEQQFGSSSRFWRTRFLVIPTEESPQPIHGSSSEVLSEEEIRLAGMDKLADLFNKARWIGPGEKVENYPTALRFLPTYLGPAASVLDEGILSQLEEIHASGPLKKKKNSDKIFEEHSLQAMAKAMRDVDGVPIKDHRWHGALYPDSFTGAELTSWLVREFRDISTREQAVEAGSKLHAQGLIEHCRKLHGFLDGHYYYRFKPEWSIPRTPKGSLWGFRGRSWQYDEKTLDRPTNSSSSPILNRSILTPRKSKRRLVLSQTVIIDLDSNKRSHCSEVATLHHDIIHNPATAFHFEFNWISTSARCLDELIRHWSRSIEKYGLRLVEGDTETNSRLGYVDQIVDIRDKNSFQSCFPIRLIIPPPVVKKVPEGSNFSPVNYIETMILLDFGFVIDVESQDRYNDQVEVFYIYRRPYKYTQFVHRSGTAFAQMIGGQEGYRFLTNRLLASGRLGTTRDVSSKTPSQIADNVRERLAEFCSDPIKLTAFYNKIIATIQDDDVEPLTL
ncbi:hypothetical protein Clacol_006639 [Clathrus columnatus]|uniref:Vacuolar membrane-associated protein IML1 n=1 Tax=Clathrus columnatus TaxID=1419009 RepID=A0AAV5AF81_9AGAM|nr:hypothetical protein Clacol_006639 [Clathrus columnatus]